MDPHLYWTDHRIPSENILSFRRPHTLNPPHQNTPPRCNQSQPLRTCRVPNPENYLGLACQYVFCNSKKKTPMLARISITDWRGHALIDSFVHPTQPVTDYRSPQTGLRSQHLHKAPRIEDVRKSVNQLLRGKVVVGYNLWEFFLFLGLSHPAIDTRDIASFVPFRKSLGYKKSQIIPLKILVNKFMGRDIGHGYEHPLEIARACLDLFRSQTIWEDLIQQGQWPCTTTDDVPEIAHPCFT